MQHACVTAAATGRFGTDHTMSRGGTDFKLHWCERSVHTPAGRLEWTEFPGGDGTPFVACTKLAGRPISPVEGHRLLAGIAHPAGQLDYLGSRWG